ncbi:MAG: lambda-exonuclease family protein [Candidatus Polarisedimenticolia bacterium]
MSAIELADRRAAWLAERRKHITGTDLGAILGVSRYRSPIDVWLDKTGRAEPDGDSLAKRRGRHLERANLAWYAEDEGVAIEYADPHELIVAPGCPLIAATLDARRACADDRRPVEAKSVAVPGSEWGEAGSDRVPDAYLLQVTAQMLATSEQVADVTALMRGRERLTYTIALDRDLADMMQERAARWWRDHVERDVPPPIDGSESCARWLASRRQTRDDLIRVERADLPIERLAEARRLIAHAEQMELEARNLIIDAIGEGAGVEGDWGRITYRKTKDSTRVDHDSLEAELADALIARGVSQVEIDRIVARHTARREGARRFVVALKGDE